MGLEKHISTPTAILLGGAMIGVGLIVGLQRGEPPQVPSAPPAPSLGTQGPPAQPSPELALQPATTRATPQAPAPPTVPRDEVARQVAKALDAHRADLVERCWKSAHAKAPQPPSVKFVFNYTFNSEGHQLARGVSEDRATARPDVTACVLSALPALSIPPPGVTASLDVPFSLP